MNINKNDFIGLKKQEIASIDGLIKYIKRCVEKSKVFNGKCLTKKINETLQEGINFSFRFDYDTTAYVVKFYNLKHVSYTLENGGGSLYIQNSNYNWSTSAIERSRRFNHWLFECECNTHIKELIKRKEDIKKTIDCLDYYLNKAKEINNQLEELDKMPNSIKDYIRNGGYSYKLYVGILE